MFSEQEGPTKEDMGVDPESFSASEEAEVQPGAEPQAFETSGRSPETLEDFEEMKAAAQKELEDQFGMRKTADFSVTLKTDAGKARAWLSYIKEGRNRFPQYNDDWFADREDEISQAELTTAESDIQSGAEPQVFETSGRSPETLEDFEEMKAAARQELKEKFGMEDTAAFREALKSGDVGKAKAWLFYIEESRENFPQYNDAWFEDRRQEISQTELAEDERFKGMKKTADFRAAIASGDVQKARDWLQYITDNRGDFPQYNDAWLEDRQREIEQA